MRKFLIFTFTFFCITTSAPVSIAAFRESVVQSVIDGDTIELAGGKKARLIGIDTPETMERSGKEWRHRPEPLAEEAKKFAEKLLAGKKVRIEYDVNKEDNYKRILAYVYAPDGRLVNAEIVREGYSLVYTFPPNTAHYDELVRAQKEARSEKKGLWKDLKEIKPNDWKKHVGEYCSVKGKIASVVFARGRVYLNFSGDHKNVLSGAVNVRNVPFFEKEGISLSGYAAKTVEIVGKVENRGGPHIVIDNPSQIRVIV